VSVAGIGTFDPVSKSEFVNKVARGDNEPVFTIDAGSLSLWPTQSSGGTVTFDYYIKVPPITSAVNTNLYTMHHADLLLWASMIEGFVYMIENDRLQVFEGRYQNAIEAFNFNPKRIKLGATPLRRMIRM
jgi:hypothetical protein